MKYLVLSLVVMCMCVPANAVNLLSNGDFENGMTDWTVQNGYGGIGAVPTGWELTAPRSSASGIGNSSATAFYSKTVAGDGEVAIVQLTNSVYRHGETYTISFDENVIYPAARYYITAYIGTVTTDGVFQYRSAGYTNPTANNGWINSANCTYYGSMTYVATSEDVGLPIAVLINDSGHGYALHDVQLDNIVLTPEPASMLLLGLGGLLLKRRSR